MPDAQLRMMYTSVENDACKYCTVMNTRVRSVAPHQCSCAEEEEEEEENGVGTIGQCFLVMASLRTVE